MYLPGHFEMGELDEVASFVHAVGSADLVTVAADGRPQSTLVPVLWDRSDADPEAGRIVAHVARMNAQWHGVVEGQRVLAIVHGPQAYVSPSWYAAKAEHGRVVPTCTTRACSCPAPSSCSTTPRRCATSSPG